MNYELLNPYLCWPFQEIDIFLILSVGAYVKNNHPAYIPSQI